MKIYGWKIICPLFINWLISDWANTLFWYLFHITVFPLSHWKIILNQNFLSHKDLKKDTLKIFQYIRKIVFNKFHCCLATILQWLPGWHLKNSHYVYPYVHWDVNPSSELFIFAYTVHGGHFPLGFFQSKQSLNIFSWLQY